MRTLVYQCSECGHEYTDALQEGRAELTVYGAHFRNTELHWCSLRCFEAGIIRAADRMRARRTVPVEVSSDNVRQLDRARK